MVSALFQLLARQHPGFSAARTLRLAAAGLHTEPLLRGANKSYQFVVCGGGPGGLAVASSLGRRFGPGRLAVIEPANVRTRAETEQHSKHASFFCMLQLVTGVHGKPWSSSTEDQLMFVETQRECLEKLVEKESTANGIELTDTVRRFFPREFCLAWK